VLVDLAPPEALDSEDSDLVQARRAFMWRMTHTPGVIVADDTECDVPLTVTFVPASEDLELNAVFKPWRDEFILPDGQTAGDIFSQLRLDDEVGCGFWQAWDPLPPVDWRLAAAAKNDLVRYWIKESESARRPLDTEGAVLKAHARHEIVQAWLAIKPTFVPNSVPTWITASVVQDCVEWLGRHRGVVVSRNPVFGQTVAKAAGVRYFGSQGEDADGTFIEKERPGVGAVMSLQANLEGRNLQYLWHRALMVGCERNANRVEQLISRWHRYGQTKHTYIDVLCTSGSTWANWGRAVRMAKLEMNPHVNKILSVHPEKPVYPSKADRWKPLK
jgi:hypothetical protein